MEEEKIPQTKYEDKEVKLKFSLWFYIALAFCVIIFVIVSAVTKKVCYWAGAIGFAVFFAEFLRLFIKSKRALLLVVACVCALSFALLATLWIMRLCGLG